MGRRPSPVNWSLIALGVMVLVGGIALAIVIAVMQFQNGMRRVDADRLAGYIIVAPLLVGIILIAKGSGRLRG